MRVLYLHQYFNTPEMSGGTRSYEMAKGLVARGHRVTMVCLRQGTKSLGLSTRAIRGLVGGKIDGIDVIEVDLEYSNYDSFIKRSLTFIRFAMCSSCIALRSEYDLLFATSTPLTAGLPGIIMKVFRKRPFVFEVRDLWPELPREMGVIRNPLVLGAMSFLEWMCYRQADSCIGLSPGIVKGIRRRSRAGLPVALIPNGCDLDIFKPGKRTNLSIEGIGPADVVALFTGAHGIANGLDAVLDAAKLLKKKGRNDIKFLFIGDGKLKPALKKRVMTENLSNCLFLDPISKIRLSKICGYVDIGLMILANVPAFYYGTSPNKFFDYLASGLPVINNYPGWLAEMNTQYDCGIAVAPCDPEAFANALIRLAEDPEKRRQMGKNARNLAESRFDRQVLADQFVDWLEEIEQRYQGKAQGASTS